MDKKNKIKPLSREKILISLDRLTRFKPTEEKYLRVFKDAIVSNLIYPKYKKDELNSMQYQHLRDLFEEIFNFSLLSLGFDSSNNFSVNKKLLEYEKSVFKFDSSVEVLLDNKIDYESAFKLLEGEKKLPLNLKWLLSLADDFNQKEQRQLGSLKFPLEKIVIVEGITEEILLPKFAQIMAVDFDKMGIHLVSAGGKNQVVKLFYKYSDILKLPIFVLLDNDAEDNYDEIKPKLRENDRVHVLKCGEFEDAIPLGLIKRTLNRRFKNYYSFYLDDLRCDLSMTKKLEELFKNYGLEFKKAEFAFQVFQNVKSEKDVSKEVQDILSAIVE